jgi:hypothetical protein
VGSLFCSAGLYLAATSGVCLFPQAPLGFPFKDYKKGGVGVSRINSEAKKILQKNWSYPAPAYPGGQAASPAVAL